MSDSPEAVRQRILEEELAKGSDPRVAEARSKAAEMRARHGLPLDPQEAWRAKLAQEGGAPAAVSAETPSAAPEPTAAEPASTPEQTAEPAAATEVVPQPEQVPTEVPAAASMAASDSPTAAGSAPPVTTTLAPAQVEPEFEPEVGDLIEGTDDVVRTVGGLRVREGKIPTWAALALLLIPLWAMLYLMIGSSGDVVRSTTGCAVHANKTFTCFLPTQPKEGSGSSH